MNSAMKAALGNPNLNYLQFRAALFHSTPVLDRRRRSHWEPRFNYSKRCKKLHAKQSLLRNVSAYADFLFQSWENEFDGDDPSSSKGTSWFRRQYGAKGPKQDWTHHQGPQPRGRSNSRGFRFCEDNVEVESIFRSAFDGGRCFYWSFVDEENPQWGNSSRFSQKCRNFRNSRHQREDDYDSSAEDESFEPDLASDRLALGLSAYGPIRLEDVKNAYRVCALKWHPDRHQGSSKVVAEEKFKLCSAAYQSLCDKLIVD